MEMNFFQLSQRDFVDSTAGVYGVDFFGFFEANALHVVFESSGSKQARIRSNHGQNRSVEYQWPIHGGIPSITSVLSIAKSGIRISNTYLFLYGVLTGVATSPRIPGFLGIRGACTVPLSYTVQSQKGKTKRQLQPFLLLKYDIGLDVKTTLFHNKRRHK